MEKMEKAKFNPKSGLITFYSASIISLKWRYAYSKSGAWPIHWSQRETLETRDKRRSSSMLRWKEQYLRARYVSRVDIVQFTCRYWKNSRNRAAIKWANNDVFPHLKRGTHGFVDFKEFITHSTTNEKFWESNSLILERGYSLKRAFP